MHWIRPCILYTPPVAPTDWSFRWAGRRNFETDSSVDFRSKCQRIDGFRGRRSRNKVSVGEPAEGSFTVISIPFLNFLNTKKKFSCLTFFFFFFHFYFVHLVNLKKKKKKKTEFHKFLAVDLLVLATMKSVAKYDKSCELQDSVNHQILEHKWLPWCKSRHS